MPIKRSITYPGTMGGTGDREVYFRRPTTECLMRQLSFALVLAAVPPLLSAQQISGDSATPPLRIGAVAPDFTMNGATRYGVLANPVRLSDFNGKTVVLAFFYK